MAYLIRLSKDRKGRLYVGITNGDPGRTYTRRYAKQYKTKKGAKSALTQIRNKYSRPFLDAEIFEY